MMTLGRGIIAGIALMGLGACAELPFDLSGKGKGAPIEAAPATAANAPAPRGTREVTVTRNSVRLRAPEGFCVDPSQTDDRRGEAFVVFGNCAAITANPEEPQPSVRGFATALVTGAGFVGEGAIEPQAETLRAFLAGSNGRAALSRTGDASTVTVLDSMVDSGTVYVHVRDDSPNDIEGAQSSYWRAYFDAGNAVVAMSVIGFTNAPLEPSLGLSALREFAALNRVRPENPLSRRAPASSASAASTQRGGVLGRLFP